MPAVLLILILRKFQDVVARMEKSLGRNSMDVEKFRDLSKRCHDVAVANQKKEQDYEDAPGTTKKYPCFTYYLEMGHCVEC